MRRFCGLFLTLLLLALPAGAAAEEELTPGGTLRGKVSFSVPSVTYRFTATRTGVLLLRVSGLAPAAQVRLTVEHESGRTVARGGPAWSGKAVGCNVGAGQAYRVRLTLLGGAATGFTLTGNWSDNSRQLFPDQPLVMDFPMAEESVSYAITTEAAGYLDLQLSGPNCDLDLYLEGPDGAEVASRGQSANENMFVKVEANTTYTVRVEKYAAHGLARIPFTLTAWQVQLAGDLTDGAARATTLDDRPRYYALRTARPQWLALRTSGGDSADLDLAVYRDGERVVDSLQQGMTEFAVLGLQPGHEYLCKLFRSDDGWQPVAVTLAARLTDELPDARGLIAGEAAAGSFDPAARQALFNVTAPQAGVLMAQLNGDEVGELDLDLVLARRDGTIYYSRASAGLETVVTNLAAGEPAYVLASLYNRDTASAFRVTTTMAPQAVAGAGTPQAEWFGVFVGIKNYLEADDLEYCSKDAFEAWQAWQALGMRPENGRLLVDEQATKENMIAALKWLAQVAGPEDRVVFFYSGHGTQEENGASANPEPDKAQDYLAPYNSQNANYRFDLPDDVVGELLDAVPARVQVVALDACYAGGFRQELEGHPGRLTLMASLEDQTSGESSKFKGGLMVGVLLQALREFAPRGVPAGELVRAIRLRVPRLCPDCFADMGGTYQRCPVCGAALTGENRAQQPVVTTTLAGETPLLLDFARQAEDLRLKRPLTINR